MNTTLSRTRDLRLASYLLARGYPLIGTEPNGRRIVFVIDAPEEAVRSFYGPSDSLSAKRLFESWRSLRDLLPEVR
jgi:hypothetical protein